MRRLVLLAHPDLHRSRVSRRLADAAGLLGPDAVELRDLYALYPDYAMDVGAEQAALARADLVVWLHPIQWYAPPALMKLWIDEVLTLGWAYGRGGDALRGKDLWLACSTGGREEAYHPSGYNRHFFDAFLPPYEQTAALCGLRFLPPLVLHGAHGASDAAIDAHAALFAQRLASYPAWPELDELPACEACVPPDQDRPREADIGALS
ncbi:NAD(P)H-dependent oxidoreductase [Leptothrix discophora]|uniref:NAD(P)H-dependent oxidoreductase n=1 Tax=Leptothrix discophora TaxID=89 RepID=A0ABT9G2B5_LEPDI|nr:NAD(P)H-dependent oxidoreductase [Leptothrix discophora]MDP4300631.1 NAD(P)H-dependent oxidoreductase [Leptothrix discophora]